MKCRIENIQISGIGAAVPDSVLDLRELSTEYGVAEVERIIASTGVEAIRLAPPEVTASDLCEQSARALFQELHVEPGQVDGIVFVSQTPDYILPATSVILQNRLGLPKSATAFDIPYGCSGYIYGLFQAALLIHAGACQQVLVCAGDTITRFIHPKDRSVRMVFGDAGSATLVKRGRGVASFVIYTDGSGSNQLIVPGGGCRLPKSLSTASETIGTDGNFRSQDCIFMNGAEIMNFALREVPDVIDEVLLLSGWAKESVGLYGLHQANKFIIDYLAKKARLPKGSAPVGIARTGNTGPASIPLMLCTLCDELSPERRFRSVFCGFGAGLSWGACAVELAETVLVPTVELKKPTSSCSDYEK